MVSYRPVSCGRTGGAPHCWTWDAAPRPALYGNLAARTALGTTPSHTTRVQRHSLLLHERKCTTYTYTSPRAP
jgi:hypothetical protein